MNLREQLLDEAKATVTSTCPWSSGTQVMRRKRMSAVSTSRKRRRSEGRTQSGRVDRGHHHHRLAHRQLVHPVSTNSDFDKIVRFNYQDQPHPGPNWGCLAAVFVGVVFWIVTIALVWALAK
jgi:hypothetical protein